MEKINIPAAFARIADYWSPHVAAEVNGQEVRLAKISGAFDWHFHDGVDELFFVVRGRFTMEFRDGAREWATPMEEGDLIVVAANTEHRPVAVEECWVMLVETAGARNTGEKITARTRHALPRL